MKQRLGALLCLALGAVLVSNGLVSTNAVSVGEVVVCQPQEIGVSPAQLCPTGTISITEQTTGVAPTVAHGVAAAAALNPPAGGWTLTVTSDCIDPSTGSATNRTITIPNNGTTALDPLFVYTNYSGTTQCAYALTQTNTPAGFTPAFAPASPVSIPFGSTTTDSALKVTLTNSFRVAVTTPPVTSTVPVTSPVTSTVPVTSPVTSTVAVSSSAGNVSTSAVDSTGALPTSASASSVIANTGPREQVRTSFYLGLGLLVLGLALLLGGLPRRRARHRG